jgi:hypothetical protein
MNTSSLLRKTFALVAIAIASCGAATNAATNSGLDLTRPLDSAGFTYEESYLAPGVFGYSRTTDVTIALPHGQFALSKDFTGQNDLGLQYTQLLPGSAKFRQTIGALGTSRELGGLYQLAYDMNGTASLQFLAKYTIGTTPLQGTARYNELTLSPYALFTLPEAAYAAVIPEYHAYAGGLHADTYDAKLDVGRVFSGHYNLSAFYGMPIGQYSYANLYRSTYGAQLQIQL